MKKLILLSAILFAIVSCGSPVSPNGPSTDSVMKPKTVDTVDVKDTAVKTVAPADTAKK